METSSKQKKPIKPPPGLTAWEKAGNRAAITYRYTPVRPASPAQGQKAREMAAEGWHG